MNRRVFALLLLLTSNVLIFYYSSGLFLESEPYYNLVKPSRKYIVYECAEEQYCGGWADRLKGIAFARAWALLTNRTLAIRVTKPCDLKEYLEPNLIDWTDEAWRSKLLNRTELNFHHNQEITKRWREQPDENILNYNNALAFDVIILRVNLDLLRFAIYNHKVQERIVKLGIAEKPYKFTLPYQFRTWYNELFQLSPRLAPVYDKFLKQAKPQNKTRLICAQIRIGGAREHVPWDHLFMKRMDTAHYWKYIRDHFLPSASSDYRIFITSDHKAVQAECINEFGRDKVVYMPGLFTHMDFEKDERKCSRVDKTILDFHAMQLCDMTLISQSGFGRLGSMLRPPPANENLVMRTMKSEFVTFDETYQLTADWI